MPFCPTDPAPTFPHLLLFTSFPLLIIPFVALADTIYVDKDATERAFIVASIVMVPTYRALIGTAQIEAA